MNIWLHQHQHTPRSDRLATPSTKPEIGRVALYTQHTTHHGLRPRAGAGKSSRHTHDTHTPHSYAIRTTVSVYVICHMSPYIAYYCLCGLYIYINNIYICIGSTAVYCAHTTYIYSLLTSTVATRYCHNHITTAVADRGHYI